MSQVTGPMRYLERGIAVALVIGCASCSRRAAVEEPRPAKGEPSFAAQAEAVRRGESEQIRLDHTLVDDEQLGALAGLEDKLRRINLSQTSITDAGLAEIGAMHRLEQLRLASGRISDEGLAALAKLKNLRHLHLIDAPITDAGVAHLAGLKELSSLYLDGTKVTDEGMAKLVEALPGVHLHFDGGHHRGDPRGKNHEH
jgi:hypothetical protein